MRSGRLDAGLTIFCLLSVLVPLTSGKVMSMERFATCVGPGVPRAGDVDAAPVRGARGAHRDDDVPRAARHPVCRLVLGGGVRQARRTARAATRLSPCCAAAADLLAASRAKAHQRWGHLASTGHLAMNLHARAFVVGASGLDPRGHRDRVLVERLRGGERRDGGIHRSSVALVQRRGTGGARRVP